MTACPECREPLDAGRVLDGDASSERVAAGVDTEAWFWTFRLSCARCRSAVTLAGSMGDDACHVVPGSAERVAALEERLRRAARDDNLREIVTHRLASVEGYLLATPELLQWVREGLADHYRLVRHAFLWLAPGLEIAPALFSGYQPPDRLGAAPPEQAKQLLAAAGGVGGWVPAIDDPIRIQPSGGWLGPERPPRPGLLRQCTRLALVGVWNGELLLSTATWKGPEHIVRASRSLVAPDE